TTPGTLPTCSSTTASPGVAGTTFWPDGGLRVKPPASCACTTCVRWFGPADEDHFPHRADRHGRARPAALRPARGCAQPPRRTGCPAHPRGPRSGLYRRVPARATDHRFTRVIRPYPAP